MNKPLPSALLRVADIAGGARVVAMMGISGSGKTRAANALAASGYRRLSADRLLWERFGGDSFPSLPETERREAFSAIDAILADELRRLLAEGRSVVVDSTLCRAAKRENVRRVCREAGVEPRFVYLDASHELLAARLATRRGDGPDDQVVTPGQLDMYYRNFERPLPSETDIVTVPANSFA